MAKFCKVAVSVSVGARKSSIVLPLELEGDDVNTNECENELGVLISLFVDSIKSLPAYGKQYTWEDIKNAGINYFGSEEKENA
ncbi:MAG: hypothetical protein HGA35_03235 [Erysipelotrichaceae bacterium]|nr:hypothetical protein [Erysipelotrichaceae bacterium]